MQYFIPPIVNKRIKVKYPTMNHLYDFLFANIFITFLTQNKQLIENLNQDNKVHSYYNEKKAILI